VEIAHLARKTVNRHGSERQETSVHPDVLAFLNSVDPDVLAFFSIDPELPSEMIDAQLDIAADLTESLQKGSGRFAQLEDLAKIQVEWHAKLIERFKEFLRTVVPPEHIEVALRLVDQLSDHRNIEHLIVRTFQVRRAEDSKAKVPRGGYTKKMKSWHAIADPLAETLWKKTSALDAPAVAQTIWEEFKAKCVAKKLFKRDAKTGTAKPPVTFDTLVRHIRTLRPGAADQ
jgi:hypothetical protein